MGSRTSCFSVWFVRMFVTSRVLKSPKSTTPQSGCADLTLLYSLFHFNSFSCYFHYDYAWLYLFTFIHLFLIFLFMYLFIYFILFYFISYIFLFFQLPNYVVCLNRFSSLAHLVLYITFVSNFQLLLVHTIWIVTTFRFFIKNLEEGRLVRLKCRETSSRFSLCCFVIYVYIYKVQRDFIS